MLKKIILRLSNEMGNQMFMYASAYSISKKLNRKLYIDDETAFLSKKNISKYGLNHFNISSEIAPDYLKFKNFNGYLKRKFLIKTDFLRKKKKFLIENKNINKITYFNFNFLNSSFDYNLHLEGHYESEKYFLDFKNKIKDEFAFNDIKKIKENPYYKELNKCNSVAICLRQNRFSEGVKKNNKINNLKSNNFTNEQINYINKSIELVRSKVQNPKFFLWSNDLTNLPQDQFNFDFNIIDLSKIDNSYDKRIISLFLLSSCKHFIVTTSAFNWWGAWLSNNYNKLIFRPSEKFFSEFRINNKDFWPSDWIKIS